MKKCLIFQVFSEFKAVILTSGTMSPMEMYPKLLDFKPVLMKSVEILLQRNTISPIVIGRGNDQMTMSSEFQERNNKSVMRSTFIYSDYGSLLIDLSTTVPDGIICFFPSYRYMEEVILNWNEMGILE
jgi:DNA excision repair protein ERCC-2